MAIERPHPQPPGRPAPPREEAAHEYRLLDVWLRVESDREVRWWNNQNIALGEIRRGDDQLETIYRGLDAATFAMFERWVQETGAAAIDLEERTYACEVIGRVRDAYDPKPTVVTFAVEDVLLHWQAYRQVMADTKAATPGWLPFFFRGGIPMGLALLAKRMENIRARSGQYPENVASMTWLPGLAHRPDRVGQDPVEVFVDELVRRRAGSTGRFHVWAMDVTFTGSSVFSNLQNALARVPKHGVPVDVTLAVLLPVEANVAKNVASRPENERFDTGLRSASGEAVWLKKLARPDSVRTLSVRIYPVAQSLTEDVPAALELSYGLSVDGRPTYVRGLSEDVTIRVVHGDRVFEHQHNQKGGVRRRGDTAHDWIFSELQQARLPGILASIGLPSDPGDALRNLVLQNDFAQYAHGPICLRIP